MGYGNYPDLSSVRKILIIKLRHHGDVLLTSPLFSYLKSQLPMAAIDALIYKETAPMLEGHPSIRCLHLCDKKKQSFFKKWKTELGLLRKIRKEKYDLVINLTEGDRGAIVVGISGAKVCVGLDPEKNGFLGKSKLFTHLVKPCKTPRHTVEKNLDALRRIGLFPGPEERDLSFYIPESIRKNVAARVPEKYIVIHPVSRWKFKCWPVLQVAELIQALHQQGHSIVLTASSDKDEVQMVEEIIAECPRIPITNLAGRIDLKELGAVIDGSELLVCVDSVPLHIASALKKPVVVLFGPTSEMHWGPWKNPHALVVTEQMSCRPCFMDGCGGSKRSDCLATLRTSQVLRAIQILKSSPK
jgi:heptosyltransferase-3